MKGGDNGPHEGPSIGRTLELARKQRGLSLEQVEEATKIRTGYLRDLERENFDVLPAVYVQGSLRTYANFLHLDAEAMVQELKRRQAPEEKPPYPLYVGPPQEEDSLDDILKAAGGTEKSRAATEEDRTRDAAPPLLPAGVSGYLYLASAVFVILVVAAVVVAFNAAGDSQPAVSQVREPLISRAPETAPPGTGEVAHVPSPPQNDKEQSADDEKDKPQRSAGSEAKDEKPNQAASAASQNSPSATATASAAPQKEKQKATAEPDEAAAEPDEAAAQPSRSTPSNTQTSAPARQTAPPSSARPAGQPKGSRSGDGGQTKVKVVVGGKDPVKLSGGPFDD